jgi:hypothetical protein
MEKRLELKLESPVAHDLRGPSVSAAVAVCLKAGVIYGSIVMLAIQSVAQLDLTEAAFFIGVPAGVLAALVMAQRLDQGLPSSGPAVATPAVPQD